mgnify:FL=1
MKIEQLSLFLENRPGHLSGVCRTLAEAGIDILTLSLADTQQFGILRLIVRDWRRAQTVLTEAGSVVKITELVAIEVEDKPGGLARILEAIEAGGINVEYMYAFSVRSGEKAVLCFRFDDPDAAIGCLQSADISVLNSVELYERAES